MNLRLIFALIIVLCILNVTLAQRAKKVKKGKKANGADGDGADGDGADLNGDTGLAETASGSGRRPLRGNGSGRRPFRGSGSGRRPFRGSGSGSGRRPFRGSGSGRRPFRGSGSGRRPFRGSGSGANADLTGLRRVGRCRGVKGAGRLFCGCANDLEIGFSSGQIICSGDSSMVPTCACSRGNPMCDDGNQAECNCPANAHSICSGQVNICCDASSGFPMRRQDVECSCPDGSTPSIVVEEEEEE